MEVLLLHRHLDRADVLAGISATLWVGSTSADVVALEARKPPNGAAWHPGPDGADRGGRVVILADHRPALLGDERPLPSVDKYDTLLRRETS